MVHRWPNFFAFPAFFLLLLPLLLFLAQTMDAVADNSFQKQYTREGFLEATYSYEVKEEEYVWDKETSADLKDALLFFDPEKDNRQVFDMDMTICYKSQGQEIVGDDGHLKGVKHFVDQIKDTCNKGRAKEDVWHGIRIELLPDKEKGNYRVFSLVDQAIYRINISDFSKDEVKVLRKNRVPKYCFRLQMGRMPPDPAEVLAQQDEVRRLMDAALMEAAVNNASENITQLFGAVPMVSLQVEDVAKEFALRTVDLSATQRDAADVDKQLERESNMLMGSFVNKTAEEMYNVSSENRTLEAMNSTRLYSDFVPMLKTSKHYAKNSKFKMDLRLYLKNVHNVNITFSGGNIAPCRTEWVELDKFEMERDFFHEDIHAQFSPIRIAYTVGLVGWKEKSEQGFGPGQKVTGKVAPEEDNIDDYKVILNMTEGIITLEERYKRKFGDGLKEHLFNKLEEYYVPLQLNHQKPLSPVTVKQLVFACGDNTFNLPHVASFVEGIGL